jgi:AraC family transcriptional regulator of adaptative response / DNA-3-methyladenine glycosylase II
VVSGPVNAVVTTGIYCRPGCPASPSPDNVRTYAIDVQAEKYGFRPCLRCRPDRRAPPTRWRDVPQLVADGLDAICHGALDGATESELARRLGASPRHFRRLFTLHLGITANEIAISRRAHFARRLLDETDLPIAQVAFAAGFGSVRTMNSTMRRVFRFTPTELRSKRRQCDHIEADGGIGLTIPLESAADPSVVLAALDRVTIAGVESVSEHSYLRVVLIAGHPGAIRVRFQDPTTLCVEAHLPRFDCLIELAAQVRHVFAYSDDPPSVRSWAHNETAVKQLLVGELGDTAARSVLSTLAAQHGTDLAPLAPLGLTRINADYQSLAEDDWIGAGLSPALARRCRARVREEPTS